MRRFQLASSVVFNSTDLFFYLSGSELVLKIRKVDASVSTELNCLDDSFF